MVRKSVERLDLCNVRDSMRTAPDSRKHVSGHFNISRVKLEGIHWFAITCWCWSGVILLFTFMRLWELTLWLSGLLHNSGFWEIQYFAFRIERFVYSDHSWVAAGLAKWLFMISWYEFYKWSLTLLFICRIQAWDDSHCTLRDFPLPHHRLLHRHGAPGTAGFQGL